MLQKWHVNCGFSRGAGILPIPSLTNFQNKGGAFKILARINGHISDARPGLILLPDLPPMPIIWPPRVGAVLAAQVRNSGHVIVFSGKIAQTRRPEVARVWVGGGFWGAEIRDHGHVIVFSGQNTQIRHPGSCAVLPKMRLTTYKFGSPAHKAVSDKLKVL